MPDFFPGVHLDRQTNAFLSRLGRESVPVIAGGLVTGQNSVQSAVGTHRVPYYLSVGATDLRLVYTNWMVDGTFNDIDNTVALVINASIEYSGTIYRVLFNGRTTGTCDPGGVLISDPLPLELVAGSLIYVRTFQSGTNWFPNRYAQYLGGGGFTVTTDLTAPGSAVINDNSALTKMIGPSTILGTPMVGKGELPPSVLIVGDSIAYGQADGLAPGTAINTVTTQLGGGGYIVRALNGIAGMLNIAVQGDTAKNFGTTFAGRIRRMFLLDKVSSVIFQYGRNDISNLWTYDQVRQYMIAGWTLFGLNRGIRTFATTITPRTTSTDGWLTTANQTVHSSESLRTQINDWLRDGAPLDRTTFAPMPTGSLGAGRMGEAGHPLRGLYEIADLAETSRNSGIWKVPASSAGRTVADANITSALFSLTSATANFTSADLGKVVLIAGAGAAGGLYVGVLKSVTNSTTVSVTVAAGTTVTNASCTIIDGYTADGIHPQPAMAQILSAGINTALLA